MSYDLFPEFTAYIQARQLLKPGDRVLVAVSSGPDSMALLHLLQRMSDVELGVFHLNHKLRAEADEEADYVAAYADKLGLPVFIYEHDVNRYAREHRLSVEAGARKVRYQLMRECMEHNGYTKTALGHHRDDQAETVLMHLIRGTGLAGLGGMKPVRDCYIRPLLPFARREIMEYCHEFGIKYYHDQTNFSPEYGRNKLRLELIPLVEAEYNPKFREHLAQLAEIVQADEDVMKAQTDRLMQQLTFYRHGVLMLPRREFAQLSLAFQRRLLQTCIAQAGQSVNWIAFEQIERLRAQILSGNHFACELPLITVLGEPNIIVFGRPQLPAWEEQKLPVPGEITAGQYRIKTEILPYHEDCALGEEGEDFDLDQLSLPLTVRRRRPGDRMQVFGQTGLKKIKDLLIEAKLPRYLRDYLPIICDQKDAIWVCGVRRSEKGRITPESRRVLRIKLEVVNDCHDDRPMI